MNDIHDMGGMQGAGPVAPEKDEPVFHEQWEKDAFAIVIATLGQGLYTLDELRHGTERMSWVHYLEASYYEHGLTSVETLLTEKGIISREDLKERVKQFKENPEQFASASSSNGPTQLTQQLETLVRNEASTSLHQATPPNSPP